MYTQVNGMRSARYPLQGCGCSSLGQTTPAPGASTVGAVLPILGLAGLVLAAGWAASGGKRHVTTNRRRRR